MSNLGALRILTLRMKTFWSGKMLEVAFSISLPIDSGINLATNSFRSHELAWFLIISTILRRIWKTQINLIPFITRTGLAKPKNNLKNMTNLANLTRLSIACSLLLIGTLLGKSNAEHAKGVAVSCLHINMSLNQSLPLTYKRPKLVRCEIHSLKNEGLISHNFKKASYCKKINNTVWITPTQKLVRTFFPWTSSALNRIFLYAWSSSFWRSARLTSKTLCLSPSEAICRGKNTLSHQNNTIANSA